MAIEIIDYDHERDFDAVKQIWLDVGWMDEDNVDDHQKGLEAMLQTSNTVVFPIEGVAEFRRTRRSRGPGLRSAKAAAPGPDVRRG